MAKQDYINAICHCDELNILPETPRGNFMLFLLHWINAGCKPLDLSQLQVIIGMKDTLWHRHKTSVISAGERIIPVLRDISKRKLKEKTFFDKYNANRKADRIKQHTFSDSDIAIQEGGKRPQKYSHGPSNMPNRHTKTPPDTKEDGMFTD